MYWKCAFVRLAPTYCREKQIDPDYNPVKDSSLYAFWAGSVTGPFVHILAIAHVLLWGLLSSIAGSVVSSSVITQFF